MAKKTPRTLRQRLVRELEAERRQSAKLMESGLESLGLHDESYLKRFLESLRDRSPKPLPERRISSESRSAVRQWIFLREARLQHPEILEELEADVLPRTYGEERDRALLDWQEGFCLTEPWVHTAASMTLKWWGNLGRRTGSIPHQWYFEERANLISWLEDSYIYELPSLRWSPRYENEEAAIARCREQLERALEDFTNRVRSHGLYSAYRRTRKEEEGNLRHYRWLVAKQVEGRTYPEIAEPSGANEETVGRAVRDLANDLGLTLRDDRRGRPVGRKDSKPRHDPTRW